jgi:hypothetical protein
MKSHPLEKLQWIRSRAAVGDPLNLHAVMRERPDLLEQAFALPTPRGWRRCLVDAGVDPYKIAHAYKEVASCAICGFTCPVLGTHLKSCHGTTGEEYIQEFGPDCELSSESFRATKFAAGPVAGIAHWEGIWSHHQGEHGDEVTYVPPASSFLRPFFERLHRSPVAGRVDKDPSHRTADRSSPHSIDA